MRALAARGETPAAVPSYNTVAGMSDEQGHSIRPQTGGPVHEAA